jgi:hypothetical protein
LIAYFETIFKQYNYWKNHHNSICKFYETYQTQLIVET